VFHTLVASGPRARPSAHRFLLSVSFHGVAVAGAIALTRRVSPLTTSPHPIPALVFVAPQARQTPLPAASDRVLSQAAPTPSWEPFAEVPDLRPLALPTALPSVADLLGAASLRSGSSPALPGSLVGGSAPTGAGGLWTADSVDDPVEVIEQPSPRYPPVLAQAGVAGRVELEYVVDTLGRAEPGSLHALTSTRPEFEAAARAAVLDSRYRPARLHGQVVRQLVRQVLSFRTER
jgi:TonB family protein